MNDYGRNDEMQLKRPISAEFDIKNCLFFYSITLMPHENLLMPPILGTAVIDLD